LPNYCNNKLEVAGKPDDLKQFNVWLREVENSKEDTPGRLPSFFNNVIPMPEDSTMEQHVESWGTKWDVCEIFDVFYSGISTEMFFDTAWSPPEPVVLALSRKFPALQFTLSFFEMGCCFAGVNVYRRGGLSEKHYSEDSMSALYNTLAAEFGFESTLDQMNEHLNENEDDKQDTV